MFQLILEETWSSVIAAKSRASSQRHLSYSPDTSTLVSSPFAAEGTREVEPRSCIFCLFPTTICFGGRA